MKKIVGLFLIMITVCFSKEKIRAVSTAQFTTEMLLSIGASSQMVGTAYLDDDILPELKKDYDSIPVLAVGCPTKERFYETNPNFLTGWRSIATPKNLGSLEELNSNGVEVYFPKSLNSDKIEDIYSDILYYGKRFNLEKNALKVVEKMKKDILIVQNENKGKKRAKILAYDSQKNAPFVIGGKGIGNTIIELAGGDNIFKNANFSFGTGTWEKVISENPEFIIIIDYGKTTYENKVKFLQNESPISDLDAVKNKRFIRIPLSFLSSGIKVSKAVQMISDGLKQRR